MLLLELTVPDNSLLAVSQLQVEFMWCVTTEMLICISHKNNRVNSNFLDMYFVKLNVDSCVLVEIAFSILPGSVLSSVVLP